MTDVHPGVELVAYPPRPNPPLILAFAIIAAGLTAPFLFLRAGSPSLFLGIGSLSLALAGIIALAGALNGRRLYSADPICRPRARITAAGITLYKSPPPAPGLFFPRHQISNVQFLTSALIVHTKETHPSPGRHAVRFGKLETPRADIVAAIRPLEHP